MDGERVFRGYKMQRGYGLGGFFAKLMRGALPLLKTGSKYVGEKMLKTGVSTLRDAMEGVNPRTALKRRIADVSDEMLDDVKRKIRRKMSGNGIRKKKKIIKKKIRKRKENDVFAI